MLSFANYEAAGRLGACGISEVEPRQNLIRVDLAKSPHVLLSD